MIPSSAGAPHPHSSHYTKCPEDISLDPLKRDFRRTNFFTLKNDISAGVAIALLSIPQAIAYSISAGVPPVTGLLSTIFGTIVASILGSSRHLIIAPNNAIIVLVQTAACEIFATMYAAKMSPEHREVATLQIMTVLTMLIGLIQIVASVFKLGRVLQFVSHAVVIGYITGSAFAITLDQLFIATGVTCPDNVETLFQKILYWLGNISHIHLYTLGVTVVSLLLLNYLKKKNPVKILPPSLLMLVMTGSAVALLGIGTNGTISKKTVLLAGGGDSLGIWSFKKSAAVGVEERVESVEELQRDELAEKIEEESVALVAPEEVTVQTHILDAIHRIQVDFALLNTLIPVAFAIAFLGMLETSSIAKTIAVKSGQRLTSSQDIFALGCSNLFISLLSALPCSGSMSRTATNYDAGGKTRFSGVFSGIFVAIIVLLLGPFIAYLPQASLAALLLFTAPRMIDMEQILLCLKATRSDALVIVSTFFACIFFSLHIAFYMGVTLSIALYLRKAATPRVIEYQYNEETCEVKPMTEEEHLKPHLIRIINVEGELFFGAVDLFQYILRAMSEDDRTTKVLILRLKHVRDLDATAALALKQLKEYLERKGRKLIISSVPHHIVDFLESSKLFDLLGRENIIMFDENVPHSCLERAICRGKEIIAAS